MPEIRAIILAAGYGSRLAPLTDACPKCMVPLLGKTILDRQLKILHGAGIRKICVVTGHGRNNVPLDGLTHFVNENYNETNMVYSLMCAREWIDSGDDIIICYGDIVYTQSVLKTLLESEADISVCVDRKWRDYWQMRMENPLTDAETMKLGSRGEIIELGKKPKSYDDIQGQYIGLQLWRGAATKKILAHYDALDRSAEFDGKRFQKMFMTSFIQSLIDEGFVVMPAIIDNGWLEIDTLDDMKMVESLHALGRLSQFYNDV